MGEPKAIIFDPHSGEIIGGLLIQKRFKVALVSSLSNLLSELKGVEMGCLILGDDLDGARGYELIPVINSLKPDLPIIVTVVENLPDLELRYRLEDVFYYHVQPLGFDDLVMAVENALQRRVERKVLVVDDDYDFIEGVRRILENHGFKTISAFGTDEAFVKVSLSRPDLILVDLMMQGVWDGFRLCWRLKGDKRFRDIPILMMTSLVDAPDRLSLLTSNPICAEDFLSKPIRADELIQKVCRFTGG